MNFIQINLLFKEKVKACLCINGGGAWEAWPQVLPSGVLSPGLLSRVDLESICGDCPVDNDCPIESNLSTSIKITA